jgi:hypothetical protein
VAPLAHWISPTVSFALISFKINYHCIHKYFLFIITSILTPLSYSSITKFFFFQLIWYNSDCHIIIQYLTLSYKVNHIIFEKRYMSLSNCHPYILNH